MFHNTQAETSEFEKLRRSHETKNERLINLVRALALLAAFGFNWLTYWGTWAPLRSPKSLIILFASLLVASCGLEVFLRLEVGYHPWRKYLLCLAEISFAALGFMLVQGTLPTLYLAFAPTAVYAVLIVLAGLRYSTSAVILAGVLAGVAHVALLTLVSNSDWRGPAMIIHLVITAAVTTGVAYNVASLIRIHQQSFLQEQLKRFLPPELMIAVARDPSILNLKTERRVATVLFTDIRGFTRISEHLPPEKVVEFLNGFLDEMTQAIMDHGGMLDKYIGDAVLGVFGIVQHVDNHAERALQTAIDMSQRLIRLNDGLQAVGLPMLSIGIGLHTGELLVGSIGSVRRLDYTVIGDTVNLASRIEGLTRSYPVEILLSDETRQAVSQSIPLHEIATVTVKNRAQPVRLWSPAPPNAATAPELNPQGPSPLIK
jgi:adenylate cyclase